MKKVLFPLIALLLALGLALPGAMPAVADPDPGLVGLWHFDEGSGQTAADTTGVNDGQLGSTSGIDANDPSWTSGKFGNALSFDGVDDHVEVPSSTSINPSNFTLEYWLNLNSSQPSTGFLPRITGKSSDVFETAIAHIYGPADNKSLYHFDPTGGWTDTGYDVSWSTWTHLVWTYDGSTLTLFANGVNVYSAARTISLSGDFFIGRRYTGEESINGIIDEVRIWDEALGDDAILQSYELGTTQTETCVVQLSHQVLTSGDVVCFTSAFYLDRQAGNTTKTVDIYIMSASGNRTIDDVGLRGATPKRTQGNLLGTANVTATHWSANVTNGLPTGLAKPKGRPKNSTSIHLYAELDTLEWLGVNAQYLPWD